MARMRISILLPLLPPETPSGGYRVHLEYANRLSRRGHCVTVIFPKTVPLPSSAIGAAPSREHSPSLAERLWWFAVDDGVRLLVLPDLRRESLPPADVVVLTSWATAEAALDYPHSAGRKVYVVYDYEYWRSVPDDIRARMSRTFLLDGQVVATSVAVEEMLADNGVRPAATIECGLDFDTFAVRRPIEARHQHRVGLPLRNEPFKGTADGIAALREIRHRAGSELQAVAFGSVPSTDLPPWIEVVRRPTDGELCDLLNTVSVFILPSHYEGWGLPGCEAMACGAALVTTDSVGVRSYAHNDETALVVPPRRPSLLARAVLDLFADDGRRQHLAAAGSAYIRRFTWDAAVSRLEHVLAG